MEGEGSPLAHSPGLPPRSDASAAPGRSGEIGGDRPGSWSYASQDMLLPASP